MLPTIFNCIQQALYLGAHIIQMFSIIHIFACICADFKVSLQKSQQKQLLAGKGNKNMFPYQRNIRQQKKNYWIFRTKKHGNGVFHVVCGDKLPVTRQL
jgi:hypothetical protein